MSRNEAKQELVDRQEILVWVCRILGDGAPRTARAIQQEIERRGWNIDKPLLNSVLHREGRAYLHYDFKTHKHWTNGSHSAYPDGSPLERAEESDSPGLNPSERAANAGQPQAVDAPSAESLRAVTSDDGFVYKIEATEIDSPSFFTVESHGRLIRITLNRAHQVYSPLSVALSSNHHSGSESSESRATASAVVALLLMAWARYEAEQPNELSLDRIRDVRHDWSRIITRLLKK